MRKLLLTVFVTLIALSANLSSQFIDHDYAPMEMQSRTIFIKAGNMTGSAFSVAYEGKIYLVTAKHVVAGLPVRDAVIQIREAGTWKDYQTVRTIFPSSDAVDIAVFETNEKAKQSFRIVTWSSNDNIALGDRVWFFGYPWGIESHFVGGKIAPFVKCGTLSAIDLADSQSIVLYVDGFNNPGFSGGPIVEWDQSKRVYRIMGVVKGYREDSAKIVVNGQHVDTNLMVNSGILVGYSIEHAMKAIEESQKQAGK
jgi:S1-C subfamily serine protease